MVRLRIFGSGRVLLESEDGRVIEDFICADVEKAQEIVMNYVKEVNKQNIITPGNPSIGDFQQ